MTRVPFPDASAREDRKGEKKDGGIDPVVAGVRLGLGDRSGKQPPGPFSQQTE